MAERELRIGLFGRLGSGNIGNDATLEAVLAYLKAERPDAVLDFMCSGPDQVTQRYGVPAVQVNWLHAPQRSRSRVLHAGLTVARIGLGAVIDAARTVAWVRRHDVVIVPGMGVLESSLPQRPWQLPYSLFLLSAAGRFFGTKVAFVSVGATVTKQWLTGRLLAAAARLAYYRSFRDEYSLEAARGMGMAGDRDQVYPDLVFSLPSPPGASQRTGVVGIGVMAYYGGPSDRHRADEVRAEYTEKMAQFVRWLMDEGHRVRLLIGDADDEPVAEEIVAGADWSWRGAGEPPVGYESFSSVDGLMSRLDGVDTVVGTRFHTVLVALKLGKPTIAIGYGHKHNALMEQMGLGDRIQHARDFDVELLKRQFRTLVADSGWITGMLAERNALNRELLREQFDELTAVLFEPAGRVP